MHEVRLKAMAALLRRCLPRHDLYTVFGDCMEVIAISIANSVDRAQRDGRETRYLALADHYGRDVLEIFARILAELVAALGDGPSDVLGALFHDLELHNKARGQFFTPYPVSRLTAGTMIADRPAMQALIDEHGFITAMEPACGAGSMIIALADALHEAEINYQRHLHVTAIDIDQRAVHMAYAQLSLLHVPAHLIVGDALSGEYREHWFTPAHILGGWNARLAERARTLPAETPPSAATIAPAPLLDRPRRSGARPDPDIGSRQLSLF